MAQTRAWKDYMEGATAIGTFVWPKLAEADMRFEPEFGTFSVDLDLSGEAGRDFQKKIDKQYDIEYAAETEDKIADGTLKADADGNMAALLQYNGRPYAQATEGKEKVPITDTIRFKFKTKAGGRFGKKHPRAGETWTKTGVPIFPAHGNLMVHAEVWGGTKGRVSFKLVPWYTAALGFGVRLELASVKVIDLVSKGERSAESYGYEDEEGYVPDPSEVAPEAAPKQETSDEPAPDLPDGIQF